MVCTKIFSFFPRHVVVIALLLVLGSETSLWHEAVLNTNLSWREMDPATAVLWDRYRHQYYRAMGLLAPGH